MPKCPRCRYKLDSRWEQSCPRCRTGLVYCPECHAYSELLWRRSLDRPEIFANCARCDQRVSDSVHLLKSSLFGFHRYAFKFVNAIDVPPPMYFEGSSFPFGKVTDELGNFVNDFRYELSTGHNESWEAAHGYLVDVEEDYHVLDEGIALLHESGVELFLIPASASVGRGTARANLTWTLEAVERQLNLWWQRHLDDHWDRERLADIHTLVDRIDVRTPLWHVTVDGRFSPRERQCLFEHLSRTLLPTETIEEFTHGLADRPLAEKIVAAARRVTRFL